VIYLTTSTTELKEPVEQALGADLNTIFHLGPSGLKKADIAYAYVTADEIQAATIVEIGAGYGISSVTLGAVAKKYGGKLYSVEYRVKAAWWTNLKKYGVIDHVELVQGRNPFLDWSQLDHIRTVDYLLIDGNHCYMPVMVDFFTWVPRVRNGGRIAFHDYLNGRAQVKDAVDKLEKVYPLEYVGLSASKSGLYVVTKSLDERGRFPKF